MGTCLTIASACVGNKKELVQDLTRKAKQVEYLIRALPDKEDPKQQVRIRLSGRRSRMSTDLSDR